MGGSSRSEPWTQRPGRRLCHHRSPRIQGSRSLVPVAELTAPGGLDTPVDVAVAPDGTIWVTEGGAGRFAIFAADGSFLERWGRPGAGDGEFDFAIDGSVDPSGTIAWADDGSFYVTDPGNFRVQHFDRSRRWIGNLGAGFGQGDGQFLGQTTLALMADGRVLVQDGARNDLQLFAADGAFLGVYGRPGAPLAKLDFPGGPAVVGDHVFVPGWTEDQPTKTRITEFDASGTVVRVIEDPALGNLFEVNLGSDGLLYGADWDGRIHVIDPNTGKLVSSWTVGPPYPASTVQGLGVAADGRIFAAEWTFDRVEVFRIPTS